MPLSAEAQRIIAAARPQSWTGYLFQSAREGVISDMTLGMMMRRQGLAARQHGMSASLRMFLTDCTDASYEMGEVCLRHVVGSAVSRGYNRGDLLEQHRGLMERWA